MDNEKDKTTLLREQDEETDIQKKEILDYDISSHDIVGPTDIENQYKIGLVASSKVVKKLIDEYKIMNDWLKEQKGMVTGLSTGFNDLDYITNGFQKGDLLLLAGWKHMGKLGMALSIAYNTAVREKITTAVFCPDMSGIELMKRLFAIELENDAGIVFNYPAKKEEWEKFEKTAEIFANAALYIDDNPYLSVKQLVRQCFKLKEEKNLGFIIIDNLQFLDYDGDGTSPKSRNNLLRNLKEMAEGIGCPVLVISELPTDGEKKWNKRPELSDLNNIEYNIQYADVIMLMYCNIFDYEATPEDEEADVIIVKNRNGRTGTVKLSRRLGGLKFKNLTMI